MLTACETSGMKSGDVNIAYQITGDGPIDLVLVAGFVSHLEMDWEDPRSAYFLERLASFSRLIRFDKRGTGLRSATTISRRTGRALATRGRGV